MIQQVKPHSNSGIPQCCQRPTRITSNTSPYSLAKQLETRWENWTEPLGSWFQHDRFLAMMAIWEMNKGWRSLFLHLSPSHTHSVSLFLLLSVTLPFKVSKINPLKTTIFLLYLGYSVTHIFNPKWWLVNISDVSRRASQMNGTVLPPLHWTTQPLTARTVPRVVSPSCRPSLSQRS